MAFLVLSFPGVRINPGHSHYARFALCTSQFLVIANIYAVACQQFSSFVFVLGTKSTWLGPGYDMARL